MTEAVVHSPNHPGNQNFVAFAQHEMGKRVRIDNFSREFGRPSVVWRLTGSDGSRAWLKHHENSQLYRRELTGLERFVPALGAQTWWSSPTLVTKDDEIEVILMTEVEGEVLELATASADEEVMMFRLAGRFARKVHDLTLTAPDGIAAAAYLRDRLEHYLSEGERAVDSGTVDWARVLIDQACSAGGSTRGPYHRDFSPRNWLIQHGELGIRLGVIDWERAGWDVWLQDVQRMAYDHWHHRAQLREAYFEGYGRGLTAAESLQLDAICLVTAIASIPWAVRHNDDGYAALNREVIERIRARLE